MAEMTLTKEMFGKNNGRQYIHMVQSFSPDENLDYETAHKIALEMAEYFEGFQVLVATHKDRNHIHSHFVINSVNFETGYKFQQSKKDMLEKVRPFSDAICLKYGLSVIAPKESGKMVGQNEYQTAAKDESWKRRLAERIEEAMSESHYKEDFLFIMEMHGYEVNWSDKRKHITYTTPDGNKFRCNKLHDVKFAKENMEAYFEQRIQSPKTQGQSELCSGETDSAGDGNENEGTNRGNNADGKTHTTPRDAGASAENAVQNGGEVEPDVGGYISSGQLAGEDGSPIRSVDNRSSGESERLNREASADGTDAIHGNCSRREATVLPVWDRHDPGYSLDYDDCLEGDELDDDDEWER